jgi:hypothetical protein
VSRERSQVLRTETPELVILPRPDKPQKGFSRHDIVRDFTRRLVYDAPVQEACVLTFVVIIVEFAHGPMICSPQTKIFQRSPESFRGFFFGWGVSKREKRRSPNEDFGGKFFFSLTRAAQFSWIPKVLHG